MKTELSPKIRTYLRQVSRKLRFSKALNTRICADLQTTILAKMESGIPETEILDSLGTPTMVAADFHAQMPDQIRKKSPLRFVCLAVSIVSALVLVGRLLLSLFLDDLLNGMTRSIGIIGGADGPTSVFITTTTSVRSVAELLFWLILFISGIIGFYLLNHKKDQEDHE